MPAQRVRESATRLHSEEHVRRLDPGPLGDGQGRPPGAAEPNHRFCPILTWFGMIGGTPCLWAFGSFSCLCSST